MNFYSKYILPRILNTAMNTMAADSERSEVAVQARGETVEIGFGSGLNIPYYKSVTKLYAVDPSKELFAYAKDRIDAALFPVEYIPASAEKLPFADASIDSVVSTWSLCSIPQVDLALKEVARILKPEGTFIFIEHGSSPKRWAAWLQKVFTPVWKHIAGGCHWDRKIADLIMNAGLEIKTLKIYPRKYKPLLYMYKGSAVIKK